MSNSIVYLNGEYIPSEQAKVSVLDRGFIFGDGVYEIIPAFADRLLRLEQHLVRLSNSLSAVKIDNPFNDKEWMAILNRIVSVNSDQDQSIYLQITRGVAQRDHSFPSDSRPTVFVMSSPLSPLTQTQLAEGVTAITLDDIRWQYCHIKTTSLLPNILLRQQAVDQNAAESILIKQGKVTEGAASNVFIVNNGIIMTPPKGDRLLPGITRDLVVELAQGNDLPCDETPITESTLNHAEEIWLTSSNKEIMPVTRLNGKLVGKGLPGPVWHKMYDLFQDFKDKLRQS